MKFLVTLFISLMFFSCSHLRQFNHSQYKKMAASLIDSSGEKKGRVYFKKKKMRKGHDHSSCLPCSKAHKKAWLKMKLKNLEPNKTYTLKTSKDCKLLGKNFSSKDKNFSLDVTASKKGDLRQKEKVELPFKNLKGKSVLLVSEGKVEACGALKRKKCSRYKKHSCKKCNKSKCSKCNKRKSCKKHLHSKDVKSCPHADSAKKHSCKKCAKSKCSKCKKRKSCKKHLHSKGAKSCSHGDIEKRSCSGKKHHH